jgi:hypothetical protein
MKLQNLGVKLQSNGVNQILRVITHTLTGVKTYKNGIKNLTKCEFKVNGVNELL